MKLLFIYFFLLSISLPDTIRYSEDQKIIEIEYIIIVDEYDGYIYYRKNIDGSKIEFIEISKVIKTYSNKSRKWTHYSDGKKKIDLNLKREKNVHYYNKGISIGTTFNSLGYGGYFDYFSINSPEGSFPNFYFSQIQNNSNSGYEDYTSVFGSVNVYGDRYDGEIEKIKYTSIGFLPHIGSSDDIHLFLKFGFFEFEKKFYQSLYDSYEILGNNGLYYIDSTYPKEKNTGMEFGFNIYILNVRNTSDTDLGGWNNYHFILGLLWSTLEEDNLKFKLGIGWKI